MRRPSVADMANRHPTSRPGDRDDLVARRLELLSAEAEWAAGHTRVRPAATTGLGPGTRPDPPPDPSLGPPPGPSPVGPPAVPVPGRHASRRDSGRWGPERWGLAGSRLALGPAQVAVLAVGVAVALAVTCWWVVRGDSQRLEAPAVRPAAVTMSGSASVAASPAAAAAPSAGASVTVDVAGKVRRPGIVVLDAGARVADALEAAGGARPHVNLSVLNLARVLVDGEQVLVGRSVPAGVAAGAAGSPTAGAGSGALVNLNTATAAELETLPQVGPVTAASIVSWRDEHGGFTAVDELLEVDGIGDATLAQIAPHATV